MPKFKFQRIFSLLLVFLLLFSLFSSSFALKTDREFRAVWVSSVYNLDYPSSGTVNAGKLKAEAVKILDSAKSMGLNAVILQVRPSADALYDSDIFPWSKFLTGEAGTAPSDNFDPLEYWIDEAHARGLELHAWINPYRVTKKYSSEAPKTVDDLPDGHPAKKNPSWVIQYTDGDLYFDPGLPEIRQLIIDGAVEICKNYDVDGIHLDDYFYPGADFDDDSTFNKYKGDLTSKDDWRRNNVDLLVKGLHDAIKKSYPDVSFGISPFGIWANDSTISQGSATGGGESYTQHYADTRKWVKLEWLDYIAPQIYWHIGHKLADYETLAKWWADVVSDTDVKLYIGHAAYKVGNDSYDEWDKYSQIISQLELNDTIPEISGSIFFRYGTIPNSLYNAIAKHYSKDSTSNVISSNKGKYNLEIMLPDNNITTSQDSYYIGGTSDSSSPLYLNGEQIFSRSEDGFFGTLVSLEKGKNEFTFTQNGKSVTRTITRKSSGTSSNGSSMDKMDKAEIIDAYPSNNTNFNPGNTITFSCTAPVGSIVKVTFNNKTFQMTPADTASPDLFNTYATTYTYKYQIPESTKSGSLGNAVYSMRYKNQKTKLGSDGTISVSTSDDTLYATVESKITPAYSKASSSGGPAAILHKGMTDIVTETKGNYSKLGANLWVHSSNLSFESRSKDLNSKISKASYSVGSDGDHVLNFKMNDGTVWASFDANEGILTVSVSPATDVPDIKLPDNSLFSEVSSSVNGNRVLYSLTLKDNTSLGGYYANSTDSGAELIIRSKRVAKSGAFPLSAHTIVVDAGHGGYESGALGLLGDKMPEKDINLKTALILKDKLESLGATVIMTREDDSQVSLENRLDISYTVKPDLFISIHANSMNTDVDCSKISGFSVFYREQSSVEASKAIFDFLDNNLGRPNKGRTQSNLYVTRGTWSPAVLFEAAFLPNPSDFQWLIDEKAQEDLAEKLALAIVDYFN